MLRDHLEMPLFFQLPASQKLEGLSSSLGPHLLYLSDCWGGKQLFMYLTNWGGVPQTIIIESICI